ncbi:unnamed protein product [Phyllotreta striolata]|uniref:Uncharacterized protein n=1 Tax=Phyllotreta striolata TaxID=444603 RepID=A0A9N9TR07_PHYSR|nr:unnamed protein product [Phyllotreta striolata]
MQDSLFQALLIQNYFMALACRSQKANANWEKSRQVGFFPFVTDIQKNQEAIDERTPSPKSPSISPGWGLERTTKCERGPCVRSSRGGTAIDSGGCLIYSRIRNPKP